jgi:hypothetical protein
MSISENGGFICVDSTCLQTSRPANPPQGGHLGVGSFACPGFLQANCQAGAFTILMAAVAPHAVAGPRHPRSRSTKKADRNVQVFTAAAATESLNKVRRGLTQT